MTLGRFLVRRLLLVVPLLVFIAFLNFMLVRISGQDPTALIAGPTATGGELAMVRAELGLDRPLHEQFLVYIGNILTWNLGQSWVNKRSVLNDIWLRLPITLELLFWGVGLGALIGIPVGLRAARHHDGRFDQLARFLSLLGFSTPTYWLGLVMILVFFYFLNWAPPAMGRISLLMTAPPVVTGSYLLDGLIAQKWDVVQSAFAQLVLPVTAMAIVAAAPIIKQARAIALDVQGSEFVRSAQAAGLSGAVIRRMVAKNSATPVITFVGTELTALIGTASVIEYIFSWGGLGQWGLQAIIQADFMVVQGYVLTLALFSVLVFLVIDVAVFLLEPRAEMHA
ncbi:MAG: ABC transporter permease [Alphaproteobacteria bacterium]|nr:ABC transporter permease [Alphaproteobacteria bacterium]